MMHDFIIALLVNTAIFSLLFGIMLLVRKLFQKSVSAVLQYVLWAAIIVKLVLPFGFESPFGTVNLGALQAQAIQQSASDKQTTENYMPVNPVSNEEAVSIPPATPVEQQINETVLTGGSIVRPEKTENKQSMDIYTLIFGIWVAGALATAIVMTLSVRNLRSRAFHSRLELPPRTEQVLNSCKQELEICRKVNVLVQTGIPAPSIMGVVSPILILPASILDDDESRIRHICIHELTHLKYGDLIVLFALNMLEVIYWFNPFVWICFRFIRRDMETACDHRVIGKLGKLERQKYIGTLLAYSGKGSSLMQAGMGDGRLNMEKRIKGIFRKSKTGLKARAMIAVLSSVILAVCIITACQPLTAIKENSAAPDAEAPASETMAQPSAENTPYQTPAEWTEKVSEGYLTIDINAKVTFPQAEQYSVLQTKPADLTQEEIDKFINYFAGEKKLYVWPAVMTKTDYQNAIIEAQKGELLNGEYVVDETSRHQAWVLGQQMPSAPETYTRQYTDGKLTYFRDYNGKLFYDAGEKYLMAGVESGNDNDALILASSNTGELTNFQYKTGWSYFTESQYEQLRSVQSEYMEATRKVLENINFSKDDAQKEAQKVLDDLGIKDFGLVKAQKAVLRSMQNTHGLSSNQPDRGGYLFTYVRGVGDISGINRSMEIFHEYPPQSSDISFVPYNTQTQAVVSVSAAVGPVEQTPDAQDTSAIQYSQAGNQEKIDILVTEQGVEYFSWNNMQTIVKTTSVQLLPFSQIQKNLKKWIQKRMEPIPPIDPDHPGQTLPPEEYMQDKTVTIDSAELKMGWVSAPGTSNQEELVPMWVFGIDGGSVPYVLNAIDGSAIDGSYGSVLSLFNLDF